MKKKTSVLGLLIALFALTFIPQSTKAQLQEGNMMVGASLADFGLDFQKGNTGFSMSISPRIGYFVKDNIAIGGIVKLGLNTQKNSTMFDYGIGAFGRYYFSDKDLEVLKSARWFLEVDFGFNGRNTKVNSVSANTNGLGIGFGPGLAYFITDNIALEGLLKYNITTGFGNSTTNNRLGLNLGFQIYLPTKKVQSVVNDMRRN
ncbi:outer membrane beta-barrel protein [Gynurincola endophyticus]|jgi:hypothetical protein|uniref:outer membrane beta-barrel protein n=1 Tax=Gynurincola endophyticus TaxID=2479004 RepID=UPI000F8F11C1|nr:outer membrane beta-barrel protein [Gynurincola endophyticus]